VVIGPGGEARDFCIDTETRECRLGPGGIVRAITTTRLDRDFETQPLQTLTGSVSASSVERILASEYPEEMVYHIRVIKMMEL
jgi:hypothetical protein